MEPKERKLRILAHIIESYADAGEPVGSKTLAELLGGSVSSATVRSDMSVLADSGYLEQPHASAGRVPTQKGYRFYVDRLMSRRTLPQDLMHDIDVQLTTYSMDPDNFLVTAAESLSEMTGMAAVVTTPSDKGAKVQGLELMPTGSHSCLMIMLIAPSMLRTRLCRVGAELDDDILTAMRQLLRDAVCGKQVSEINGRLMGTIRQMLGSLSGAMEPLLSAVRDAARGAESVDITTCGLAKLFSIEDTDISRDIISFLSDSERFGELIASRTGTMNVAIGREMEPFEMREASMITARYRGGVGAAGWVGVVGGTRVNYAKIIPHIEYFATAVGRMMSAISDNA